MKVHSAILAAALATLAATGASAGSLVAPTGYTCTDTVVTMPLGAWFGGFDVLPSGNFAVSDGCCIREITPSGIEAGVLYTYETAVYGSFVRYNAANDRVYFGESSANAILSVPVSGGPATAVATVPGNYDMDFWSGVPFVVGGSAVFAIDEVTGELDAIAEAGAVSGPLIFNADGSLIYGTGNPNWPPTTGDQNIYMWSKAQVEGALGPGVLGVGDAVVLAANVNAPSGFAFNELGELVYTDSQVAPAVLRVVRDGSADLFTTTCVPGELPWATVIRSNPAVNGISVAISWLDSSWQSHTVISTVAPVPEPSGLAALAGLVGLAVPALRIRRKSGR